VLVGIEIDDISVPLYTFIHPQRCAYLLGAEDTGLDDAACLCDSVIEIPSSYCLNVATTGAIVMYDRSLGR